MNKVFVFYLFTCVAMFGCLTMIFVVGDIGQYLVTSPGVTDDGEKEELVKAVAPFTLEEFSREQRRKPYGSGIRFPKLMVGYMYSVNSPVVLYDSPNFEGAYSESLPQGGIFRFDSISNSGNNSFVYRVSVNDGRENYVMYLSESTLPETQFYGQRPQERFFASYQERVQLIAESADREKAELVQNYENALVVYRQDELKRYPKNLLVDNIAKLGGELATIEAAGVVIPMIASAILTFGLAFMVLSFVWLRNSRVWESDVTFDDVVANGRGADYYEPIEEEDVVDEQISNPHSFDKLS